MICIDIAYGRIFIFIIMYLILMQSKRRTILMQSRRRTILMQSRRRTILIQSRRRTILMQSRRSGNNMNRRIGSRRSGIPRRSHHLERNHQCHKERGAGSPNNVSLGACEDHHSSASNHVCLDRTPDSKSPKRPNLRSSDCRPRNPGTGWSNSHLNVQHFYQSLASRNVASGAGIMLLTSPITRRLQTL